MAEFLDEFYNSSHEPGLYEAIYTTTHDTLTQVEGHCLEIGTHRGGSAYMTMQAIRDAHIIRQKSEPLADGSPSMMVTVDPWGMKHYPNSSSRYGLEDQQLALSALGRAAMRWNIRWHHCKMTADDFLQREQPHGAWYNGVIQPYKWAVVLLDGEHSCEAILREFICTFPYLVKGGKYILDNVDHQSPRGSIIGTMKTVVVEMGFEIEDYDNRFWVLNDVR